MAETRIAKAVVDAYRRSAVDKLEASAVVSDEKARKSVKLVVKPPKVSGSLKKAGVLLVLAPDPVTLVPGVAMIGAGYAMRKREPSDIEDLVKETRKTMRELQSLL